MLEFFFDCSSPWSYLAFRNLRVLGSELGVPITWKPILVGGVFNRINPSVYEQRSHPVAARQTYSNKDLQDWARRAGVEIRFPPTVFPVNSAKGMRACLCLQPEGRLTDFAEALFRAYWSEDRDISQTPVLEALCEELAIDSTWLLRAIETPEIKARLRGNTDELVDRGGFGSPTIFVHGDDMYFGNDRLVLVREALVRKQVGSDATSGSHDVN